MRWDEMKQTTVKQIIRWTASTKATATFACIRQDVAASSSFWTYNHIIIAKLGSSVPTLDSRLQPRLGKKEKKKIGSAQLVGVLLGVCRKFLYSDQINLQLEAKLNSWKIEKERENLFRLGGSVSNSLTLGMSGQVKISLLIMAQISRFESLPLEKSECGQTEWSRFQWSRDLAAYLR